MKDVAKTGWETRPLGEVCQLINGRAYKKPELLDEGPYPVLRVGNFFTNNHWYYSDLELDEDKYCDDGDLLYAWSASFGPRIWEGGKVIYHYHIWKVLPSEHVDRDFLYYFFDWDKELIKKEQGAGATMIHVSKRSMEARAIPLPPLEEQQRIVAVLDEAFEALTRARAHAEANLQNARELSEASVDAVFDRLPHSTPVDELQHFCTERGITYGVIKLGEHDPEGVPCLRTSNVRPLHIDTEGMKWIRPKLSEEYRRTILEGGEVLVNVRGTLGGVATVPENMAGWNISREVAMVPVDRARLDPDFASFFISTRKAQQWLTGVVKGAAYKGINLTDLRLLRIPVPSLEAQNEIIDEIKELRERMIVAEDAYERKLCDLYDLRQSLLQKAFAGELI